jgi:hypothetical protein
MKYNSIVNLKGWWTGHAFAFLSGFPGTNVSGASRIGPSRFHGRKFGFVHVGD